MHLLQFIYFKHLGYLGIYLSLALGILGVPIPDEALMTYLGYLIQQGKLSFLISVLVTFLGSITGMSLSYLIGSGILSKFESRLEKRFNLNDKRLKLENLLDKYGNVIIIFGYFFPGIRHLTAYSSGMLKMNYLKFLIYSSIGALIWVNTFIVLGYYLGSDWKYIFYYSIHYKNVIALTVILLVVLVSVFFLKRKKEKEKND